MSTEVGVREREIEKQAGDVDDVEEKKEAAAKANEARKKVPVLERWKRCAVEEPESFVDWKEKPASEAKSF